MGNKVGRLSHSEEEYILANADRQTPEEIGLQIARSPELVRKTIKLNKKFFPIKSAIAEEEVESINIRQELLKSEKWKRLKQELTSDEIRFFEEEYVKLISQFKGDVLPSEETQIFDAIKFEILKSRNMIERRRAREDIARLEDMQKSFLKDFHSPMDMTDDEKSYSLNLESQLQAARAAEQSRTTEYTKLQEREDALMKSLKSTRDQRIKQIENSKVTFLGVIRMLAERDQQEVQGRQMKLMQMATDKEYERLGRPTKYDNGDMDSPILSADTVDLSPEEDES